MYTIVATIFNDEKYLKNFIENLLSQTVLPNEIIIADGGSKDNSVNVIKQYADNSIVPIRILSGQRLNISQGLNLAIKNSCTELIGVAAIGNIYPADFYEKLLINLENNKADVSYPTVCGTGSTDFSKMYIEYVISPKGYEAKTGINHGCILKKSIFENSGYFYEGFYYAGEDAEFSLRIRSEGYKMSHANVELLWKTPQSWREYRKFVRVRTIGAMQVYKNINVLKTNKCTIVEFLICILSIISGFYSCYFFLIALATILIIELERLYRYKFSLSRYKLHKFESLLSFYTIITNSRFLLRKNKICNPF